MKLSVAVGATVLALALTGISTPAVAAPKADLVVKSGSLTLSGGHVVGSFKVKNRRGFVRRTTAQVSVVVGGAPRALGSYRLKMMWAGKARQARVDVPLGALPPGNYPLTVCADASGRVKEKREDNNCAQLGTASVGTSSIGAACGTPGCNPIPYTAATSFPINDSAGTYWAYIPADYQAGGTPWKLLIWLHGCGGNNQDDIWTVADVYDDQRYIAIAPDGAEGGCWDMNSGPSRVLAARADAISHFNIDPRQVVIAGYSSGGDLAYRTAFYNAKSFAGLLAMNTSPFQDTGSTQAQSLAAAAWKFHLVHLAHISDEAYPLAHVNSEIQAMTNAGFPVTFIAVPGAHYDANTDHDLQTYVLPHMSDAWLAPAS